jgi:lipoprotein-anchoring transpeptidase ErfK/SrfK
MVAAGVAALGLAVSACSSSQAGAAGARQSEAWAGTGLRISPANGARNVRPGTLVTVTAKGGRVRAVVVAAAGDPVAGRLSGRGIWRSRTPLRTSRRYTVTATVVGRGGKTVTVISSFRTLTPRHTFSASILEGYHQEYGVGMPIVLTFNRPIRNRAAVERSLSLTTSRHVVGAWYWDGNETVEFRPRAYWPAGTRVRVTARFAGVQAARGVYGTRDLHQAFLIGPSLIVRASARTHYMNVYYKGKLFGHWAISTGRPGDDTSDGKYLTIEKGNPTFMKGPGYALWVPWAVRFTWSGEYIHDAYWSVWAQGSVNVSHGCVNTSPAHARTYYKLAVPGDPVIVTGSPRPGTWDNGWTEWFLTWKQLLLGSALHAEVVAGPRGSSFVAPDVLQPAARLPGRLLHPIG